MDQARDVGIRIRNLHQRVLHLFYLGQLYEYIPLPGSSSSGGLFVCDSSSSKLLMQSHGWLGSEAGLKLD